MKALKPISILLAMILCCVSISACSFISINTGGGEPATEAGTSSSKAESSSSSSASSKSSSSSASSQSSSSSREIKFKDEKAKESWDILREERYVYYWSDSDNEMIKWPGAEMKKNADGSFSYTIPEKANYIIFNEGSDLYQTVDIPFDGSVTEFQLTGEKNDDGKYLVESWDGKAIENATTYDTTKTLSDSEMGVSIENISIEKDYFKGSFSTNGGHDAVIFKLKNNTNIAVNSVTMYVVFLDSSNKPINTVLVNIGGSPVAVLTTKDTIIQPGQTQDVSYSCNASGIAKEEYIVAAYTTTDRIRYENSDASAWASKY